MKVRITALLLLIVNASMPLAAKDKQYVDGTLLKADKSRPNLALAMQGTAAGMIVGKVWYFNVKVGDFTYGANVENGKVKEGEYEPNSPVKVRLEKKGGGIATRTSMYVLNSQNKEIELNVYSIRDKADNEYCGKMKCDTESAEKKMKEGK
jgi:hypothetical protein